jgi:hypothetical protein
MKNYSFVLFSIVAASFLSSCKQSDSPVTTASKAATYFGQSLPFSGDSIRSWIKTDVNGNPSSIGVTFKQSAFVSLESQSDTMFVMSLPFLALGPDAFGILAPPFDHIEVDWSKNGDPKPSVYDVAHFDVHFFVVSEGAQNAVMAGSDSLTTGMDTKYLPSGYMLDMNAEAMMGVHAMDTTGKEFHNQPFDHTLMYGFYQGNLYFMEPMVAKTYLDSKTNFSADIRQPQAFKKSGWYPTKYNIGFDGTSNTYTISIDNFVQH